MTAEYWEATKSGIYSMANPETKNVLNAAPSIDAIWADAITASNQTVMKKVWTKLEKKNTEGVCVCKPKDIAI